MWEKDGIVLDQERQKLDMYHIENGYFMNFDDFEEYRQKNATPDENKYFMEALSFFDGIRPYLLRRDKTSRFHLTYEIGRGRSDAAIAYLNAGANDFNSVSGVNECPSALLGSLFYVEKSSFDEKCNMNLKQIAESYRCSSQSHKSKKSPQLTQEEVLQTMTTLPNEKDRINFYNDINYLNDFVYIYKGLKSSSMGLNKDMINQYMKDNPNSHAKEGLEMLEKLSQVSEKERFLPKPKEDKKNIWRFIFGKNKTR